jgi:hypothetical protein
MPNKSRSAKPSAKSSAKKLVGQPSRTSPRLDDRPYLSNVTLVIHNGGWAEVLGDAKLNLPAGAKEIEILGLPDENNFVAGSLRLDGINGGPGDVTEVEVNYEPPTCQSGGMSHHLQNLEVEVEYRAGNNKLATARGRLLADNGSTVELQVGNNDNAKPEKINDVVRIKYPCMPSNFRTSPAVLLTAAADKAGEYLADLRLSTRGLSWNRAYEVELDRQTGMASIKGVVNLPNNSSVDWWGARIILVQGQTGSPQDDIGEAGGGYESLGLAAAPMPKRARSVNAAQVNAGDVKLYVLPGEYNLKDKSQKTVTFFRADDVPVEQEYRLNLRNRWWYNAGQANGKRAVAAYLKFKNEEGGPINQTLPAAVLSVREKGDNASRSLQTGQGSLGDLPVGEEASVYFTNAIDVLAEVTVTKVEKVTEKGKGGKARAKPGNPGYSEEEEQKFELRTCEVKLTNRSRRDAKLIVEEMFDQYGELQKGSKFQLVSGAAHETTVALAAGAEETVTYVVKVPVN